MMIVCGLDPKLPQVLKGGLPVCELGVDDYVKELMIYLEDTYKEVFELSREAAEANHNLPAHGPGAPLAVGDHVLRLKPEKQRPKGSTRFEDRCFNIIYTITRRVGPSTFELEALGGPAIHGYSESEKHHDAHDLVKLDMPELDFDFSKYQNKRLEFQAENDQTQWRRATLERVLPDATVVVRYDDDKSFSEIVDLSTTKYRWIYAEEDEARG